MTDTRPCTCAPDERPYPCQHQCALGLCRKAEIHSLRTALDRLIEQIADLTKLRLGDELVHGNVMGRIAIALFGDQNNRTDEECVARAAEIGYELSGAKQRAERAEAELAAARAEIAELKSQRKNLLDTDLKARVCVDLQRELNEAKAELAAAERDPPGWRKHVVESMDAASLAAGVGCCDQIPGAIAALRSELAAALENVKDYKENSALFLRQRDEARAELAAALEINIKLVGAIDMIRETLNGGNVQDLLFIINNALGLYNDQRK